MAKFTYRQHHSHWTLTWMLLITDEHSPGYKARAQPLTKSQSMAGRLLSQFPSKSKQRQARTNHIPLQRIPGSALIGRLAFVWCQLDGWLRATDLCDMSPAYQCFCCTCCMHHRWSLYNALSACLHSNTRSPIQQVHDSLHSSLLPSLQTSLTLSAPQRALTVS